MEITLEPKDGCVAVGWLTEVQVNVVAARMMGLLNETTDLIAKYLQTNANDMFAFTTSLDAAARFEWECMPEGYCRRIYEGGCVRLFVKDENIGDEMLEGIWFDSDSEATNRSSAVIAANIHKDGPIEL